MQAIIAKFIGPTNHRGSRIKATCEAGSVTVPYDHALNSIDNDDEAVKALIVKLGWFGVWVRGFAVDGAVYVCMSREVEGRELRTPHPQACDPNDYIVVRAPKGGES